MKVNFWLFVSGLFLLYGVIIFATGIYYLVSGAITPSSEYNPSIWWGGVLFLAGVCFYFISKNQE